MPDYGRLTQDSSSRVYHSFLEVRVDLIVADVPNEGVRDCRPGDVVNTETRLVSVLREKVFPYSKGSHVWVFCRSQNHVVLTTTRHVNNCDMWLEEIMGRVIISALRQCFLQLDYRGLGCVSKYSSRSASGLQPCVVKLPSNFLMLTVHLAGASGNWSIYRGLVTPKTMKYRRPKLHSRTDMLILDVIYGRIRTLPFTVWRGEFS